MYQLTGEQSEKRGLQGGPLIIIHSFIIHLFIIIHYPILINNYVFLYQLTCEQSEKRETFICFENTYG